MSSKKFFQKLIVSGIIFNGFMFNANIGSFNNVPAVYAEMRMYKGIGESQMSDVEFTEIVKIRAREHAIRQAVEQAGVALTRYSKASNFILTADEISAITSTKYEIIGEPVYERIIQKITDETTAIVWKATVRVNIDNDEVRNWFNLDDNEKNILISRNKAKLTAAAENDRLVESLHKRLANATTDAERDKIKSEFKIADKVFLAIQKFEEGENFLDEDYYLDAIERYTEAINLNPDYAEAYYKRAYTYSLHLNEHQKALEDCTKAIELKPNFEDAYKERGDIYLNLREYDKAIADYSKAISLKPKFARAYNNRGFVYSLTKDYQRAIDDYSKAIEIQPNQSAFYKRRGDCYSKIGDTENANADFEKYNYWKGRE